MPLTPLDALMLGIQDEIPKLDYRQYPMLMLLQKRDAFQEQILFDVDLGGATTDGRATNAATAIGGSESDVEQASLPIGIRTMGNRIDKTTTKITQARNTAPGALANLFQYDFQDKLEKLFNDLNTLLYTGVGSTADHGVFGLQYVTDAANTTYAGIDSATYALWESYSNNNAGTPRNLTRTLLSRTHREIMTRGGNYDVIFAGHDMIEAYDNLFSDHSQVNTTPMGFADLGFTGYAFMGRPIVADNGCPAGEMYFVNSRGVIFHSYNTTGATSNSVQSDPTKTMGINLTLGEIRNENPDVLSWELSVKPQLQVRNRRKSVAVLADLQVA